MHASCFVQNFLPENKIIFTEINFPGNSSFCLALSLYSIWLQYLLSEIKRKTPTHTTEYRAHHTGIPDPLILHYRQTVVACRIAYQTALSDTNIIVPEPTYMYQYLHRTVCVTAAGLPVGPMSSHSALTSVFLTSVISLS